MGDCVADGVDDVGFLEKVAQAVQRKYSGAGKLFVSGNSAGGMMVYHLLCQSAWFARNLAAASVFSGGVGEQYECKGPGAAASKRVPLLVLHGQVDDVIGYQKGTNVDGSAFQATVDTVKGFASRRGCAAGGDELAAPFFAAQKIECRDYCPGEDAAAAPAKKNAGGGGASGAKNGSKNAAANSIVSSGSSNSGKATIRACSVPGMKHNLYNVMRSFPIDVSAAWFAKAAGPMWGPAPPS
jgi:poly(3-hydroxybutyrate) depolymerase